MKQLLSTVTDKLVKKNLMVILAKYSRLPLFRTPSGLRVSVLNNKSPYIVGIYLRQTHVIHFLLEIFFLSVIGEVSTGRQEFYTFLSATVLGSK